MPSRSAHPPAARTGPRAARRTDAAPAAALGPAAAARLISRSAAAYLALVAAEAAALIWAAAASGNVGAAAPFCVPLVCGEALACGALALGRPRMAAWLSILGAAAATIALTFAFDAVVGVSAWGLFAGGALALLQLGGARIADSAVALRRAERQVLAAAIDRVTWVPTALVLALLGRSEGEEQT